MGYYFNEDENQELFRRYREDNDLAARDALLANAQRVVEAIFYTHRRYNRNLQPEDAKQLTMMDVIQSLPNFNPDYETNKGRVKLFNYLSLVAKRSLMYRNQHEWRKFNKKMMPLKEELRLESKDVVGLDVEPIIERATEVIRGSDLIRKKKRVFLEMLRPFIVLSRHVRTKQELNKHLFNDGFKAYDVRHLFYLLLAHNDYISGKTKELIIHPCAYIHLSELTKDVRNSMRKTKPSSS